MKIVRTILVFCGIASLIFTGYLAVKFKLMLPELDAKSTATYLDFISKLSETQDLGLALIKSVPVQKGIKPEDVVESLKSLAVSHNLLFVSESSFNKHIEDLTGKAYRYTNFLSFCDARVGKMIEDYQPAYTAFMPCRIALVEDKNGQLWLYSTNLDLLIHGSNKLPPNVKESASQVWDSIQSMMAGAAKGDF